MLPVMSLGIFHLDILSVLVLFWIFDITGVFRTQLQGGICTYTHSKSYQTTEGTFPLSKKLTIALLSHNILVLIKNKSI